MRSVVFVYWAAALALAAQAIPPEARADSSREAAREIRVSGEVIASQARWTRDGARIITESRIRRTNGSTVELRQLGGAVDGIGMTVSHTPPLLRVGDRVSVRADRPSASKSRRPWTVREVVYPRSKTAADRGGADLGYVRTVNAVGAPLYWASGCAFIVYDAPGTTHLAGDLEFGVMNGVFARWRSETQSCAYLTFEIQGPAEHEVGFDRVNVMKFREAKWCRPATEEDEEECYDASAAALTTLFFVEDEDSSRNGEILDADIEFNAINFAVSYQGSSLGSPSCRSDLANTLTHEAGHLMGLDHTCWTGEGSRPVDNDGNPVPSCSTALSQEITESTMYNFQDCGEEKKISPEPDDIEGVCAIYPLADDPNECKQVGSNGRGCCAIAAGSRAGHSRSGASLGSALLVGLALLVVAGATRRRRRRRARTPAR